MAKRLDHEDYTVGWICPLEVEQIAAMEMLDEEHDKLPQPLSDHNAYSLGSIYGHNIVVAGLPQTGNCSAATVVTQLRMTFPNVRFGLLVGIGGGVPRTTDSGMIRLGHVVVSKPTGEHSGTVQYDHGKAKGGQFERTGALAPPPAVLLNAAQALAVRRSRKDSDPVHEDINRINTNRPGLRRFRFPGVENDHLYRPHSCPLQPDETFVVVHRGTIASGELVVKDAVLRDELAQKYDLLCFEMEAAGVLADFPCMVIRGISDYCDSHKNDQWHGYAAAAAAAYARQLCFHIPIAEVKRQASLDSTTYTLAFSLSAVSSVNRFIARGEELARMREALKWTGERRTAVVYGLGGMGKTQLTIAYIKRHRGDYSAVIWLNARDETSLKQSFQRVAQRILHEHPYVVYVKNAIANRDLDETIAAVKRWLDEPENNRWLVVYDNYDDVKFDDGDDAEECIGWAAEETSLDPGETNQPVAAVSKAYDIRAYLPETEHGAIIITTRSSIVKLGQCIRLQKLKDVNESLAILESTSNRTDLKLDSAAIELAQLLDGLPLALSTAGAYLDQVTTTCEEYLRLYQESWLRLQKNSPKLLSYNRAMYSTWDISYRHIELRSPSSAKLLQLWAYFDNEDLWYELLAEAGARGPAWLQELTEDVLEFNTAMRVLCEHGLAEANSSTKTSGAESRGYSVHGCVHSWMIHALGKQVSAEMDKKMAWAAIACVASHVPSTDQREYWLVQQRLLQHADRCITKMATGVAEKEEGWAFHILGGLYSAHGRLQVAEATYERALQGKEKAWGPDHTTTLNTINNLGLLYSAQDRLQEAEAMFERALEGYKKASGPDHMSTPMLHTVNNLGSLYKNQGRLQEAEAMYKRALQGKEKALGLDHTSTLDTVNNLGLLYLDLGRLREAETMFERAHQGYKKASGPDHMSGPMLHTVNNLGSLYMHQGRLQEAEAMYKRALQGREKAWGPDHTLTLNTVNNLGKLYLEQGRLQEAEVMFKQALQGYKKTWGPDHMSTSMCNTVGNLGSLYSNQGRLQEAEAMFKQALQGREKASGPDHMLTLNIVNNLGNLYKKQGRLQEAEAMHKRALQGREKALGPDHTSTLNTVNNLGALYSGLGRLQEAEAMYKRALQGYEKALPDRIGTHVPALNTLENLGNLYKRLDKATEASAYYKRALLGLGVVFGPHSERYARVSARASSLQSSQPSQGAAPSVEKSA
ncbi:hypothetical protein EsH8_I_001019 [Colletotrichum jinshuiense]